MRLRLQVDLSRLEHSVGRADRDEIIETLRATIEGLEITVGHVDYGISVIAVTE